MTVSFVLGLLVAAGVAFIVGDAMRAASAVEAARVRLRDEERARQVEHVARAILVSRVEERRREGARR